MKYILGAVIAILCSFTCTDTLYGKSPATDVDDILIINTYTEANPWSNDFITSIVNMASQNSHIGVYTAHMKMLTLDEENKLETFKESLFKSYKNPKLIVLIGCGSFIMCDELNRQWPDIPMILCGERDYTGPKETMIREHALPRTERIPISDLQKKYNLTLMQSSVYLNENLQLMKQLIPKMDKVMYIGDETYICQQNDYDLSEIIREKYPELDYQFLSAKDIRTDSLFNILNHVNPHTTGVIFSSWLYKSSPHDNIMRSNSHRVISTAPIPLFSLRAIGIEEEGGIVGGYIYNKEKYNARLLETIHKILDGTPARNIPLYYPDDGAPVFNYKSLLQRDLNPKLCPKGTIFYNMPPTFWEKYEYVIISITAAIITLLFFFQYLRLQSLSRIKRLQQQQLDSNLKYRNLINNMPILYMYEKLIKDEKGRITDTLYIDVNNFFEDRFIMRKEAVGKRGSELFPESMNEFLHFMNIALKEKRSVTFPYYYKKIDTFYDIVVKASDNGEYMHVFCVDSTELHHTQIQLRSTNRKLSMALDVANIVPWKWNLRTHTILCDVNKPIELSNNAGIMDDEQLSVPDSQYFSKIHKEDLEKVKQAYTDLIEGRIQKVKEEYRVINHADRHKHFDWVEAQAAVETYDENNKPLTLVGSSLVITERKKMETELVSAKNRAEESNKLKSAFLANMSHEIRTPLNAIVGFTNLLQDEKELTDEEKDLFRNTINKNSNLLLKLINDILELSRIESGRMSFAFDDCSLNELLEEIYQTHHLLMPSNIRFLKEFQETELIIHVDRFRFTQVITNFINNAVKFTTKGHILLGAVYKKEEKEVHVFVEDTGKGMSEEAQKKVFERFFKVDEFAQGTGLGLSICQTIAERLDGRITLSSQEGKGSRFTLIIPCRPK